MRFEQCSLAAFLLFGAVTAARPQAKDRVTYPVVYENACSADIMLNDTDGADYIIFGNSFVAEANGTLDRLSVYTELINCTSDNVTLDIWMGVFKGDINDTTFRADLLSNVNFDTVNASVGSENYWVSIADSFTCFEYNDTVAHDKGRWDLPALTFEFMESSDIYGVSEKWLTEGETYTWVLRHLRSATDERGDIGDICVGDTSDDDLQLGRGFYSHSQGGNDYYEAETMLTDSTFTMRLEMDEDLPNCTYDESDYGRKIHWQVWYFDEPLRVISQYVEASEYSVWDAIVNNTATALLLTDSEYKKRKYKFSKAEMQKFYDEVTADRCVLWANVWHMFGLCLATDSRCKGWKKVEDQGVVKNNDFGYTTYYQLEVYARVAKQNSLGDKLNSDWFKLIHEILAKDQNQARIVMNADMPTRDRPSFDAFSSRLQALREYWFGAPAIAAWVVLGFVIFAITFAIIGAVHGFGFWHADNVRISGIILFALYTSDFYTDIVFCLNLINYYNRWAYMFWLTVVFIVVPWGMNMVALSRYQNKWCEDETVRERVYQWFVHWQRLLYALAALSGSAFGTVELANSYVFGYDFFCMGLNERHLKKFNNNRLWSGIVAENLPQLCIQFWFLYLTDFNMDENTFTVYAIVLSSLSIGAAALDIYSSKKLFEALINPETGQYNDKSTLSFQVISPEIHENKARLQISTYQFRNMLAEVLMLESRAVEMHFPVATANGFKIRFSVFSRDKDADEIERIVRECIEHPEREKNLSTKIQTVWRLGAAPDVKDLKQEAQVEMAMTSSDAATISIGSASPGPQETGDSTVVVAGED